MYDEYEPSMTGYAWLDHRRKYINRRARKGAGGVGLFVSHNALAEYCMKSLYLINRGHTCSTIYPLGHGDVYIGRDRLPTPGQFALGEER